VWHSCISEMPSWVWRMVTSAIPILPTRRAFPLSRPDQPTQHPGGFRIGVLQPAPTISRSEGVPDSRPWGSSVGPQGLLSESAGRWITSPMKVRRASRGAAARAEDPGRSCRPGASAAERPVAWWLWTTGARRSRRMR
jgi:hypothetical protein